MGPLDLGDPRSRGAAGRVAARLFGAESSVLANRYEARSRIGSGGMGVVDEAFDRHLRRRVAIKRLHAETLGLKISGQLRARPEPWRR